MRTLTAVTAAMVLATTALAIAASAGRAPRVPQAAPQVIAVAANGEVRLSWTPVQDAIGYRVFRAANGRWDPAPIARTTATSHVCRRLENGVTYSFTVAAYARDGNGPLSLAVTTTPLAPPDNLGAMAGDRRVTLNWIESAGATSYAIYRRLASDADFTEIATGVVAPPFVDVGLVNDRRYFYHLRAVAGAAQSDWSPSVSAMPIARLPASSR